MSMTFEPTNDILPAFPYFPEYQHGHQPFPGLTKREYFAIKIMAGFAANPEFATTTDERLSEMAVVFADLLLKELDKD